MKEKELILFDLGGVIINLDWDKSFNAVSALFGIGVSELQSMIKTNPLFHELEIGRVSRVEFYNGMRHELDKDFSFDDLEHAFNLMLLDIPTSRIRMIENLKKKGSKVACLSNSNAFHMRRFDEILMSSSDYKGINELMDHVFLSHEIGCRKPQEASFLKVMKATKTSPSQILFFDDIEENVNAAIALGIESIQVNEVPIEQIINY